MISDRHPRGFIFAACLAVTTASTTGTGAAADPGRVPFPGPDHVVVAVLENHSFSEIMGSGEAPFINGLAAHGAVFTRSFGIAHPSQPNYFALFSGSTHGVRDNGRHTFTAPTLAGQLRAAGRSFVGYVERGSPRKHNPWESFAESRRDAQDMSAFPRDFTTLPTVSFVIPDQDNDMHDGSIAQGDTWLRRHLGAYADWAVRNSSLLIVTFDEGNPDADDDNHILTVFFGAAVRPGRYDTPINHYAVLGTIEALYGLPRLAHGAERAPITEIWAGNPAPDEAE